MLCNQTIVMHAEFGTLDHGATACPTVPQKRGTARKRVHEGMVTRTYVRARERERGGVEEARGFTRYPPPQRDDGDGAWSGGALESAHRGAKGFQLGAAT